MTKAINSPLVGKQMLSESKFFMGYSLVGTMLRKLMRLGMKQYLELWKCIKINSKIASLLS